MLIFSDIEFGFVILSLSPGEGASLGQNSLVKEVAILPLEAK